MDSANKLNKEENARLIMDFFHRIMMHNMMWFAEVQEYLGKEKAFQIFNKVYKISYEVQLKRLSKVLNFEINEGVPSSLLELSDETANILRENVAANWLANDGIWFQSVEFSNSMIDAKHCNDAAWAKFSPLEAQSIKRFLNMQEQPGLEGLKKALQFRLYAFINKQSIADETDNSFVFRMNNCRVQSARKRKGLDDYPCKSAGVIEYSTFANTIDSRIKTECLACPPDKHPDDWYCAWKFYI